MFSDADADFSDENRKGNLSIDASIEMLQEVNWRITNCCCLKSFLMTNWQNLWTADVKSVGRRKKVGTPLASPDMQERVHSDGRDHWCEITMNGHLGCPLCLLAS